MIDKKLFGYHLLFSLKKWSFDLTIVKWSCKKKHCYANVPFSLSFGYGRLFNKLATGGWFSFSLFNKDLKEGDQFKGIYKEFLVKSVL
jgi:hypothetical protein